jgi:transcriptional regulator with XRE-family HTH domain
MDGVRFGLQVRALRRRRGWRQQDLAAAVGLSRGVVAGIEQGRGDRVTVAALERVANGLGARVVCRLEWHGENLERLLDADHARLVERIVQHLTMLGWTCATETSFNIFGERGSIDVMGYHLDQRILLVVEAKTRIPHVGGMLMTLDRKTRLAPSIARDRDLAPRTVARLLVVTESATARRRVAMHASTFDAAFPIRGAGVTRWLRQPKGAMSGLWFLPDDNQAVRSGAQRVRRGRGEHKARVDSRHRTA